jgi:hypothetical protein
MPTDKRDAQALAYLARRLRAETRGCREWDDAGTYAKVSELIGQNLALAVERVLCHATDPEAKTPGAILRNFTPPRPSTKDPDRFRPPKRDEACKVCGGWCPGPCARDGYGPDDDNEPHRTSHADAAFDASLARAQLAQARAQTCDCGMRRELCKTHRETPTDERTDDDE